MLLFKTLQNHLGAIFLTALALVLAGGLLALRWFLAPDGSPASGLELVGLGIFGLGLALGGIGVGFVGQQTAMKGQGAFLGGLAVQVAAFLAVAALLRIFFIFYAGSNFWEGEASGLFMGLLTGGAFFVLGGLAGFVAKARGYGADKA